MMNVVEKPITEIKPAPWNVRGGHDVEGIAESIRVNGFRDPIEVWTKTGEIVAGEGRYHAAKRLGLETVPVVEHDFDSLASAKRYSIANNRLTDKSEFDGAGLFAQLEELPTLDGTGFTLADLAELRMGLTPEKELLTDPDDVPEVRVEAISQRGDLWSLGEHRLLCGDATNSEDVARVLNGARPVLVTTYPPYGV